MSNPYLFHFIDWCPANDQEPVADDFYKILGIEKNKGYYFEIMSVW